MYTLHIENDKLRLVIKALKIDDTLDHLHFFAKDPSYDLTVEDNDTGEVIFWRTPYAVYGDDDYYITREFLWMKRGWDLTYEN